MFWHIFLNKMKVVLRNRIMLFWTFIFPIILGTLFNLAFSHIQEIEKWDKINIAVVKLEDNDDLQFIIDSLSKETEYQIFNTTYTNELTANEMLKNSEISGYIKMGKDAEIIVKDSSLETSILKYTIDQYYQMASVSKNSLEYNKDILANGSIKVINENKSYFIDKSNKNSDYTVNYFYTLIGMTCLFGGFLGIFTTNDTEANLSTKGARFSVSPVNKLKALIAGLFVCVIIQYVEVLALITYLVFILGIDFGTKIPYILLISLLGVCAGVAMGILVSVSNKKKENIKNSILVTFTMTCSFLAGMMVIDIKYIIAKNIPILAKINPVNMITDGLYSLYCFDTLDRFWQNVLSLGIFTTCIILISYVFVRRKKYDSI